MDRDVLHLAIPAFPIALARAVDSSLRDRPVAVVPGNSDRALLQSVSSEAKGDGVFAGMPAYRARRLCPSLFLIPPNPELLAKGTKSLLEVSGEFSPISEATSLGRVFIDVSGCRRLLGPARDIAARLDKGVAERLRLQGSVGVAGNKLVSRIASDFLTKPGVCDVLRGAERSFIAPLPVSVLPGVGQARQATLMQDLNLQRVEDVAELSVTQLRLAFGPFAPLLHQRACGVDPAPVQPPKRTTEVSEEAFLEKEGNDDSVLLAELCRLVETCGWRLRRLGKKAGAMALTINYADGVSVQRVETLSSPNNHDLLLIETAAELFHKACQRRVRVKGLKLACSKCTVETRQMNLFPSHMEITPHQAALQQALDHVRDKYGIAAVTWGRSLVK